MNDLVDKANQAKADIEIGRDRQAIYFAELFGKLAKRITALETELKADWKAYTISKDITNERIEALEAVVEAAKAYKQAYELCEGGIPIECEAALQKALKDNQEDES